MNFITERGIGSYEELAERSDAASAATIRARESLRDTEQKISELALLSKHIATYRRLKPTYDRYKASGIGKLPSSEKLQAEIDELAARKTVLQAEDQKAQKEEREYDTLRQNVDMLLAVPQEQQRQPSHDLE